MCWLDDQFIVSGSKDAKMALWRINEDQCDTDEENTETCPSYAHVSPLVVKECRSAQKVSSDVKYFVGSFTLFSVFVQIRSLCFNKEYKEIAVISLNGYIHLFNAETFSQVGF